MQEEVEIQQSCPEETSSLVNLNYVEKVFQLLCEKNYLNDCDSWVYCKSAYWFKGGT